MIAQIQYKNRQFSINLSEGIDIAIPLTEQAQNAVNAFYAPFLRIEAVKSGDFIGDTKQGGLLNFKNVFFNPHGNGTHTECLAHISNEPINIHQTLKRHFYYAQVITIYPTILENGDKVILKESIKQALTGDIPEALIIRTLPNDESKKHRQYSGANPPYLHHEATSFIVEKNIKHLLLDLPSVDREQDEGQLLSHKAFWQYPDQPRLDATITELIYVPNEVKDGFYFLNIQIIPLQMDASPSLPILYVIEA